MSTASDEAATSVRPHIAMEITVTDTSTSSQHQRPLP